MADSKVYFDLSEDLFQIDVGSTGGSTGKVARRLVKWNLGRKHNAVSFPLLTKSDVASIVEHCMQALHAIDTRVGVRADDEARFVSYTMALPLTFSDALRAVWEFNEADYPYPTPDVEGFCKMLQHFFAEFSDPEDRYDLAQLLQTLHKPSTMTVIAYYCRLRTLNEYLAWLPGDTPALTPVQLRQVFHDGMP
jgi:hypothetical protein